MGFKHEKKLKRSESFLGIHFDFHAREDDVDIGKTTTQEMVQSVIDTVQPDYIQCDCKGHKGYSSYPTVVGNPAPNIYKDTLKIWREVTAKSNVSLYMHYSGVWDTEAIKHNPSWARINENGEIDKNNTSTFGLYVDELMIPQLKELCDLYGVDGVWVDGECWATCQDYSENVIGRFREETGIKAIPKTKDDPYFYEFTEFCREGFRRYLHHYVNEMHKHNPDFEIASNWAFTSFMPEPVSVDVDFISGDFPLQDSVRSARLEARCMAKQGKPWDLMAWGFSGRFGEDCFSIKSPVQLKQEAAMVLSMGGGFQAYFQQKRDGSISRWQMKLMSEVAGFCRERQDVCHGAYAVPQVGLVYSGTDFYRKNERLFGNWSGTLQGMQGILNSLVESRNSVEILMEHHLEKDMDNYPLIVLPDCEYIKPGLVKKLISYAHEGGSLLVIGCKAAKLFEKELGVVFEDEMQQPAPKWLEYNEWMAGIKTNVWPVKARDAKAFGKIFAENDNIGTYVPAASIKEVGKGKIAGVYFNYGERYFHGSTSTAREFLKGLVDTLFPNPLVEVTGSNNVDLVVNRINGDLAVNLINTAGVHANGDTYVFDEVPPVGPLNICIRCDKKPDKVFLVPEDKEIPFVYKNNKVNITLDKIEIHYAILIKQ